MSEINPYESPRSPEPAVVAELVEPESGGLWRQGNLLVMHKRATLPDRCVLTNQPARGRRFIRNLFWHPPWIYVTLLLGPLVFIVLYMMLRKHATIQIGLSPERYAKWRRASVISWSLILASPLAVCLGIAAAEYSCAPYVILFGAASFCGGVTYRAIASRMVTATRITDEYVWLKGVHRDFLATLPVWPYPS